MSRVTSKLQVTIPKVVARQYGIEPGDEIEWFPAGDAIRVVPHVDRAPAADTVQRLELFDRATERQATRQVTGPADLGTDRGWRREDLYERPGPG